MAKRSAAELQKGLTTEVADLPEHTGIKKATLAIDIDVFLLDAEKKLQVEQVFELQSHSSRATEARKQHPEKTNSPSNPKLLPQTRGGKLMRYRW
jgi:hypothetical protein